MDERLMQAMLDVDEHHWWYRGRRLIVGSELRRLAVPSQARVLDAGCGSGRMLEELTRYGSVSGVELDPDAAAAASARGVGEVSIARVEELPFESNTFDLITCLDVLEHVPDDQRALTELRRVSKPGGWLLLTVPAYQALWSLHDVANHHYRRYSRRELRHTAVASGWTVNRLTSFNTILLGPAAILRLLTRRRKPDARYRPELRRGPDWLNAVLERPLRLEASWLGGDRTLPAGLSLLAVLENPSPAS